MNPETFETFKKYIETNLGIKMPAAKKVMLETRLGRRLRALKIPSYEEYCDFVFSKEGYAGGEIQQLIDAVTTNETDFFREPQHYDFLTNRVLPELVIDRGIDEINVWSVAASTGQEAYTLAMVLSDFARTKHRFNFQILGTDISSAVLEVAQTGIYTDRQTQKIPPFLKKAYCLRSRNKSDNTIRLKPEVRGKIMFRQLNLMDSSYPLKKKYHIIFCRNVFIYFDKPTQRKVLERIYEHMAPEGYLFMGHSENIADVNLPLKNVSSAVYKNTAQVNR
ncbi:protein-glutamate O-methyltransferase CheR [Brucepastera parasyntrophica]|uniref:CheR family methyltransferase n=1 Tax=Brucepastera parasyntrophica TaxID=2880008 RepID=UPI00210C11E2|nr:protein-glutamate O-methyltransferase CheR [Brucepastera parasyntrophica]ULQ58921.1 protein-glutamate O-methyltransferase CheR [Brucepastera parasyntrophica]